MNKFKLIILVGFFSCFAISFSLITLSRFNSGQLFYYDFGIFGHTIFQLSRFQVPYINHLVLGNVMFLGDHFNPSLVLVAPLFWITQDLRILLLEQAFVTVAAGFLIFLIAQKNNLNFVTSLASSIAFLMFAGVQNPLVTDWHPESTAALFLLLFVYYFQFSNKKILYLLFFAIFLGFKESNTVSGLFVLGWLFFAQKDKSKEVIILSVFSVIYFFTITRWVIPAIANHSYLYTPGISSNPITSIQNFTNSPEKKKLIIDSYLSFGALPLFAGVAGILPLAELSIRLAPNGTIFNNISLGQHYNVLLTVMLSLATIQTLKSISKRTTNRPYLITLAALFLIASSLYTARKITGSPINVIINPQFYATFQGDQSLKELLQKTPSQGTIMAQNNILAYTVNRTDKVYLLNDKYSEIKPNIIAIDLSDGASINNYYGTGRDKAVYIKDQLLVDQNYKQIKLQNSNSYLFIYQK
jgi:uncharacterized membrane protein